MIAGLQYTYEYEIKKTRTNDFNLVYGIVLWKIGTTVSKIYLLTVVFSFLRQKDDAEYITLCQFENFSNEGEVYGTVHHNKTTNRPIH